MRLLGLAEPLRTDAFCQAESDGQFDLERLVSTDGGNRWSSRGQPTVYLAGDIGVATVECGRHLPAFDHEAIERAYWRVELDAERMLDLRRDDVRMAIGVYGAADWLLDRRRCREIATRIRATGDCQGIVVPSVGFIDDPDRWNAVLFADRLGRPLESVVREAEIVGRLTFTAPWLAGGQRMERVGQRS
jgi:RES domain-containing protein